MEVPFDVGAYVGRYSGYTKLRRLQFIADKDSALAEKVYKLIVQELKATNSLNVGLYQSVVEKSTELEMDEKWVSESRSSAEVLQQHLEEELEGYKKNMIKESIRMANNDFVQFYIRCGDLKNALSYCLKNRDYCTTRKHVLDMCLKVISIALNLDNIALVQSQALKGQHIPSLQDAASEAHERQKIVVATGIAHLAKREYGEACSCFLNVSVSFGNSFSSVAVGEDVGTYTILCGIAAFSRPRLKSALLDSDKAAKLMDPVPHMKQILSDFYGGRYSSCLAALRQHRPTFILDIYLSEHIDHLYEQIENKIMLQYCSAFLSIKLPVLADALGLSVEAVTKQAVSLIMKGKLQAKVDSCNQVLHARQNDERSTMYEKTADSGEAFVANAHKTLLRINMAKHKFVHSGRRNGNSSDKATGSSQRKARSHSRMPEVDLRLNTKLEN
jgi:COP9 signalosome complex subunit 1|eukprot:g2111.t1